MRSQEIRTRRGITQCQWSTWGSSLGGRKRILSRSLGKRQVSHWGVVSRTVGFLKPLKKLPLFSIDPRPTMLVRVAAVTKGTDRRGARGLALPITRLIFSRDHVRHIARPRGTFQTCCLYLKKRVYPGQGYVLEGRGQSRFY